VIDLDWESEQYAKREYDGRVYFCRHEGYFDDLHREWDRLDDIAEKKYEPKEAVETAMNGEDAALSFNDDVEGGAILPWHFLDEEEDDEEEEEVPPEDYDGGEGEKIDKLGVVIIPGRQRDRHTKERERERESSHTHTHSHSQCCMRTCQPGQVCIHGNRMPLEAVEERGPNPRPPAGLNVPPKWQVTVPVRLGDSSQEVKERVVGVCFCFGSV
jgi:hypothetical protein